MQPGLFLLIAGVYVLLLALGTYVGYRWGKQKSLTSARRWFGALIGFLVVFLPIFWDALPTLAAHRWYCQKEAGVHVYKTIDQWKKENSGSTETIVPASGPARITRIGDAVSYDLNSRFRSETRSEPRSLGIRMRDERIVDAKTGEVVARWLDFNTGIRNVGARGIRSFRDIKFWMDRDYCIQDREASGLNRFAAIAEQIKALGDTK